MPNGKLVVDVYDGFFNKHDVEKGAAVVAEDYKQHNPKVPDGKAPFASYFTGFFKENPESRAKIVQSAADGDLVWLHIHSTNGADDRGRAIVEIFGVQDGKIVLACHPASAREIGERRHDVLMAGPA